VCLRLFWRLCLLITLPLGAGAAPVYRDQQSDMALEPQLHQLLADVQQRPVELTPFVSDGCSGGLSAGWQLIAEALPALADKVGNIPPWEHCCIAHDRQYWRGSAINGMALRLAADEELQACVLATRADTGLQVVSAFSHPDEARPMKIGLTGSSDHDSSLGAHLDRLYPLAADLMYQAVRIGGMPCSGLPWRWGYGWPQCGLGQLMAPDP